MNKEQTLILIIALGLVAVGILFVGLIARAWF